MIACQDEDIFNLLANILEVLISLKCSPPALRSAFGVEILFCLSLAIKKSSLILQEATVHSVSASKKLGKKHGCQGAIPGK